MKKRSAVITGGSRGIGEACARALAEAGVKVLLVARDVQQLQRATGQLREAGGEAHHLVCDVTDEGAVNGMASQAVRLLGSVDILVNNAGVAGSAPLKSLSLEQWNRILAVNATGTYLCTRALLPGMLERRWGRVINLASVAGQVGGAYITAYCASKHAVLGFTRALALEVARQGVTVNAVCPGFVETDMTEESVARIMEKTGRSREQARDSLVLASPQGRLVQPDEVAYLVACLANERAGAINGQCIAIDGGMLAG